jgi:hypothetical protein
MTTEMKICFDVTKRMAENVTSEMLAKLKELQALVEQVKYQSDAALDAMHAVCTSTGDLRMVLLSDYASHKVVLIATLEKLNKRSAELDVEFGNKGVRIVTIINEHEKMNTIA